MFSIDLAQLQNRYFLVHLPAVDSASVSFSKTSSIGIIQPFSCKLQWYNDSDYSPKKLESVTKHHLLSVSVTKMLEDYILRQHKIPNINQFI